jgi:antitoxin FitA
MPTEAVPLSMASITIRNLADRLKSRLRIQAVARDCSIEDEEPREPKNLGTAINALFKPFGGFDFAELPREPMRDPPTFGK